jgi:type II secretory pathway pseudopilin PulG
MIRARCASRGGVTLVELLVVAAVVVVLLSIMIPTLRYFRVKEDDLKNLNNLRATMQDFFAWSAQHDDRWPNPGRPDEPLLPGFYPPVGTPTAFTGVYISQVSGWPRLMAASGFTPGPHWHSTGGPDDLSGQIDLDAIADRPAVLYQMHSRFLYTNAVRFVPEIFTSDRTEPIARSDLQRHMKMVRVGDMAFPSGKGALVHQARRFGNDLWHVAACDGSAALRPADAALPAAIVPWVNPLRPGNPVVTTLDGHRGRDF